MTQYVNPFSGRQFLDANGDPYVGAKLFSYLAGTSTKTTLTKDQAGVSSHTNPIILNARGEPADAGGVSYPMWQSGGITVDLVLAPSTDSDPPLSAISTWEDLAGINDATLTIDEWVAGPTPTFISTTSFSLIGDQTSLFHVGRRLKLLDSGGTDYGVITVSAYTSLTTITVVLDSGVLDSGLSSVSYGLLTAIDHSIPTGADLNWTGAHDFAGNVNLGADVDLAGVEGNDGQVPSVNVGSSGMVWWAPREYINGLIATINTTDSDHDIDLGVGECADSTNTKILKLTSGLTKQIDATHAEGTDQGGMFTGTVAADTTYYFHIIRKDSDGSLDAGYDTSATAANIPTGYTDYRKLHEVTTDASANIHHINYGAVATRTGREVLSETIISSATTNIDISLVGNYEKYIIEYSRVRVSSDGILWARYSDDDASTFKTGASDYVIPAGTSSEIILNPATFTATLSCYSGTITISNKDFVSGVTASGLLSVVYSGYRAGTPSTADGTNSGVFNVASDVTDVRIKNSAGNITNGIFTLYGLHR